MTEKRIKLRECKVGDILAKNVIDLRTGNILLSKGHIIISDNIKWVSKFAYSDIYIYLDSWNKVWNLNEEEIESYEHTRSNVKSLLDEVQDGKSVDNEKLKGVADKFFSNLNNNHTIMGCVNKVKGVDEYTYIHCMNVGMLAVMIGRWIKLSEKDFNHLFLAGVLHDVGKYRVDLEILNKKGLLDKDEYEIIKKHVIYSYQVAREIKELKSDVLSGILCHHERLDGSGYPGALEGDQIGVFGRIIAIADVYDAMISERVYKSKETPFTVMEKLLQEGFNKLDTNILLTFLNNMAQYYLGVQVVLSTGEIGEVVFIHPQCVYRPMVKVGEKYIDLYEKLDIEILDML